jgi:glycine cleavage system aminomethyltransferase T
VTSASYGHHAPQKLALAYTGAEVEISDDAPIAVQTIGESCPVRILRNAPHDPENVRLKA